MANTKQRKILIPQYMNDFSCIGAVCEDTCCNGWQVSIDQKTYKKYKKVTDKELKNDLEKGIARVRTNPTEKNYAQIKMNDQGFCPLLSGGLCSVQNKLGASYLSDVCSTYPRQSNIVNDVIEKSGTISCPEMARHVLLKPNGIEFDEKMESVEERTMVLSNIKTTHPKYENNISKYFWELRIYTITVLQNRSYTIDERMIILGMFYKKLQDLIDSNEIIEVPVYIAKQLQLVESGEIKEYLRDISTSNTIQLKIIKEVVKFRMTHGSNNARYIETFHEMLEGIDYGDKKTDEENAVGYKAAYDKYYLSIFKEKEYIIENYLVNYVFKNLFPMTNFNKMFDEYVLMVVVFATLKMHLIGGAGFHKENYDDARIIKTFQSFSREVEHNAIFLRKIHELLSNAELNTLPYMTILLKN